MKVGLSIALWLCAASSAMAQAADELVLVTHQASAVMTVSAAELRRAYMGLTVSVAQGPLRPIINESSESLQSAYLQHVVGLSDRMYQRRRLSLELQQGVVRPLAIRDQRQLVERLRSMPTGISFMWRGDAQRWPELRILRVLWAP